MNSDRVEATSPSSATTRSLEINRVAAVAASSGLPSSSSAITWICRPLIPPAPFTSLTASWMPRSLEVPKVASVPVIDPTSPTLIIPVSAAPTFPPPCSSFLQPMATASTQTRNFAEMRRMGGLRPEGKKRACLTLWSEGINLAVVRLASYAPRVSAPRILVVDDNPELLTLLCSAFEEAGYEVQKALRGRTALDLARKEKPDLAVVDVLLPDLMGYDVAEGLRRLGIPFLFMS